MSVRFQTNSRSTPDRAKRTRVSLACDTCRDRKVRCDGRKPVCSTCLRRRFNDSQCVYGTVVNPARLDSQREYIKALHDKIQHLEASAQPGTSEATNLQSTPSSGKAAGPTNDEQGLDTSHSHRSLEFEQNPFANLAAPRRISAPQGDSGVWNSIEWRQLGPIGSLQATQDHASSLPGRTTEAPGSSQRMDIEASSPHASAERPCTSDHEDRVNAMGAIIARESQPQSPKESYYGQSSIVSLQHQVSEASLASNSVERSAPRRDHPTTAARWQTISGRHHVDSLENINHFSLPPRQLADHLLEQFWTGFYQFYPWIHRPSFLKFYQSLWTSSEPEARGHKLPRIGLGGRGCPLSIRHGALNAIFALGCEFAHSTSSANETLAEEFMNKAYKLVRIDILDRGGLALVQTLLLIAKYLQSTQHPMRCWGVSGLAVRMAQGIGLHTTTEDSHFSMLELEMRRRVWHGCILTDRMVSMTLGRPPTPLVGLSVPLFSAIDDEYLENTTGQCLQPAGIFSHIEFALQNVRLGELLGQILNQLYQHQAGDIVSEGATTGKISCGSTIDIVTALEASLCTFEANLPAQLRRDAPDSEVERLHLRQRCVLHARVAHIKFLLYRPFFAAFCSQAPSRKSGDAERDIGAIFDRRCAIACFESAGKLIEIVHMGVIDDLFGAWWYALFYLITASMTLILAETTADMRKHLDESNMTRLWQLSYRALDHINQYHPMAGQCTAALQKIQKRAWQLYQGRPPPISSTFDSPFGVMSNNLSILALYDADNPATANLLNRQIPSSIVQHPMTETAYMSSDSLLEAPKAAPAVFTNPWTFESASLEDFNSMTDVDIQNLSSGDPTSLALAQNLQSVFGDAIIPDAMWQALGQDYDTQSLYSPFA